MHGITLEGEQLADIHYELKEKLLNDVYQTVNQWKKDNYHKSLMNYKEVKNSEEGFNKAQKPWVRRLEEGMYYSILFKIKVVCCIGSFEVRLVYHWNMEFEVWRLIYRCYAIL